MKEISHEMIHMMIKMLSRIKNHDASRLVSLSRDLTCVMQGIKKYFHDTHRNIPKYLDVTAVNRTDAPLITEAQKFVGRAP